MKKLSILLSLFLIQIMVNAQNNLLVKRIADKDSSKITYHMSHPLHSWTGVSNEVNSIILVDENKMTINQVAVSVKIASFDSKNANRDSHAMEVTEAIQFPNITFSSLSIKHKGKFLEVEGNLTFHGVSKTITFDVEQKNTKDKIIITGSFTIKLTQFNIEPPSLLGLSTSDEIKITFDTIY